MDSNKWQNVLIKWINCLKLSTNMVTNIDDLKNVEFLINLRKLLQQQSSSSSDCDVLTFIFNLFHQYYPQFFINNSNEIHLCDLPRLDLIAITSLLMHYTCIYDKRDVLILPLCQSLSQSTQIVIKQFLGKIDDKITIERLNNIIKECIESNIDDISSSSLQDLLKTPKFHRLEEQRRRDCIVNELYTDLELERDEKIDVQKQLAILKESNKMLTKQLELKTNEIQRLRYEIDSTPTTTTQQLTNKESQQDKFYKKEIDCLNQYVKQLENEQNQLENDRDLINEKLKQSEFNIVIIQEKSIEIERNFDLLTQQYEVLNDENRNLKDIVDQLQTLLDEYKMKENSTFECDSVIIQNQNISIQQSAENLASVVIEVQLQEAITQNDLLKEKIQQLEIDGHILAQQLKDSEEFSQIKVLENKSLQQQIEINENKFDKRINEFQLEYNALIDEIKRLETTTENQQLQQEQCYKLLKSKFDSICDILNDFNGIRQENYNMKIEFKDIYCDISNILNDINVAFNETKGLLNNKIDENENLKRELNEFQLKNDKLIDAIRKLENNSSIEKQQLLNKIDELSTLKIQQLERYELLETKYNSICDVLKSIWKDFNGIKQENFELRIQFKHFCYGISDNLKDFNVCCNEQFGELFMNFNKNEQLLNGKIDENVNLKRELNEFQLRNEKLVDEIRKLENNSSTEKQQLLNEIDKLSTIKTQQLERYELMETKYNSICDVLKSIWKDFNGIKKENFGLKIQFKEFCYDMSNNLKDSHTVYNKQLLMNFNKNEQLLNGKINENKNLKRELNEFQLRNDKLVDEIQILENCLKQTINDRHLDQEKRYKLLESKYNSILGAVKCVFKDFNVVKQENYELRIRFQEFCNDIVISLKDSNLILTKELQKITIEYDEKINENENLKLELYESQNSLIKLRNNFQDLTRNFKTTQENLTQITEQLIDKDKQLNIIKNDYIELQRFSSTLTDDLKILTTNLNLENAKQQTLNQEKENLFEQFRLLQLQLEDIDKINKQLKDNEERNEEIITKLIETNQQLTDEIKLRNNDKQELVEILEMKNCTETSLKQEVNNFKKQLNDKNQEIAEMKECDLIELQQLQEANQQLITQVGESQLWISKLNDEMDQILSQLSTENHEVVNCEDIGGKWQKLQNIINEHSKLIEKSAEYEQQIKTFEETVQDYEITISGLKKVIDNNFVGFTNVTNDESLFECEHEAMPNELFEIKKNNDHELLIIKIIEIFNKNNLSIPEITEENPNFQDYLLETINKLITDQQQFNGIVDLNKKFKHIFDKLQILLFGKMNDDESINIENNLHLIYDKIDEIYKNQLNEKSKPLKPLSLNKESNLPKTTIDESLLNEWKKKNMMLKQKLVLTENAKNTLEKKLKQVREENKKLSEQQQQQQHQQQNVDVVDEKTIQDLKHLRDAYSNVMSINSKLEFENITLRKLIDERNDQLSNVTIIKENYEKLLEENNKITTEIDTIKYKRLRDKDEYLRLLKKQRDDGQKHEHKHIQDIRNEYENKLQRMKEKMLKLYQEEVSKETKKLKQLENSTLVKTVTDLRLELFEAEQKIHSLETEREIRLRTTVHKDNDYNFYLHEPPSEQQSESLNSRLSILTTTTKASTLPRTIVEEAIMTRRTSVMNNPSNIEMEDEDQDLFNNKYLADLKEGRCISTSDTNPGRISELAWRNSLLPPHLKSSYPAEVQYFSPSRFKEEDIKTGNLEFETSLCKLLPGEKPARKKDFGTTSYKKPGPPTPSKNGGRLSLQGNEIQQQIKENSGGVSGGSGTPKRSTPNRIKALFTSKINTFKNETPTKGRRLSNIFKRPKQL